MPGRATLIHAAALMVLPIVVAAFGWSVLTAVSAVIVMLLWRWALVLAGFYRRDRSPDLRLDAISASHFVEKVRWNIDVAGLPYTEHTSAGTLGAFFAGRTVPRLRVRTGVVETSIGNSPDILRYLWGAYSAADPDAVAHLEPTPERLELEAELDGYGRSLQVWVYHHLLEDRDLCLHAWGASDPAVPLWQRWLLRPLFPLLAFLIRRSFRISSASYERACERIENLLDRIDTELADGRASILGGDEPNFTDYAFAAMTGLWLQPEGYGGDRGKGVRLSRSRQPNPMRADVERWCEDYPSVAKWVRDAYAERRKPGSDRAKD